MNPSTQPVTESKAVPVPDPKPKRRRFTEEERIANREKEIEAIKEKRKAKVREMIAEAKELLAIAAFQASAAGMEQERAQCASAIEEL